MRTTIYCGRKDGSFHPKIEKWINNGRWSANINVWFFPEIDYGRQGEAITRHPARIIELVPEMIGKTIITMSEHIILAFQQLVRQKRIGLVDSSMNDWNCCDDDTYLFM